MDTKPNCTLYVNNLNEKIKKEELKKSLYHLFSQFGSVIDIIALKTIKMRGQAFVVFKDIANATAALRSLQGSPFYNKPMRVAFAQTESEAIQKMKGTFRMKKKEEEKDGKKKKEKKTENEKKNETKNEIDSFSSFAEINLNSENELNELNGMNGMNGMNEMVPNEILLISNLPTECEGETLEGVLGGHVGFQEVRMVPGRPDLAFVQFDTELNASNARDSMNGFKLTPSNPLHITFAKK